MPLPAAAAASLSIGDQPAGKELEEDPQSGPLDADLMAVELPFDSGHATQEVPSPAETARVANAVKEAEACFPSLLLGRMCNNLQR